MASVLSAAFMGIGLRVFVSSTGIPLDNMGVMTMKIMRSTSITSTIGVTLISLTTAGAFALKCAILNLRNAAETGSFCGPPEIQPAGFVLLAGPGATM